MWVDLTLYGEVNDEGFLAGLEFAELKQEFRAHLDTHYDHRLLLNKTDPFASLIHLDGSPEGEWTSLPGLVKVNGDPTTENIAKWIGDWALGGYGWLEGIDVKVDETAVNSSTYRWRVS
jgi:6-pyruvoyl-tetrahydropterin synthase